MTQMHDHQNPRNAASLAPGDATLVDRLIDADFDLDVIEGSAEERARAAVLMSVFRLLEDYPVEQSEMEAEDDALMDATLARISRAEDAASARRRIIHHQSAEEANERRFRIPMPDLVSVAAVILIGVSVMWPIMGEIRNRSIDAGCVANLTSLGTAFSSYASEYAGRVPVVTAGWSGAASSPLWIDPLPLVEMGFCDRGHINCPGHPAGAQPGYSRQLMTGESLRWGTDGDRPIMGDRNPVIDARQSVEYVDPKMNSINHGARGQNLLNIDGSVSWLEVPVVGSDDNIWLIRGQDDYRPGLVPDEEGDIYLVH